MSYRRKRYRPEPDVPRRVRGPLVTAELVRLLIDELPQRLAELQQQWDGHDLAVLAAAVQAAKLHPGCATAWELPDTDLQRLQELLDDLKGLSAGRTGPA